MRRNARIDVSIVHDIDVNCLSGDEFRAAFWQALENGGGPLTRFFKLLANPRLFDSVWKEKRGRIFARDGYTCTYCSATNCKLECDHVHPLSKGGSDSDDNLTTACERCNRSKGAKTVEEWMA